MNIKEKYDKLNEYQKKAVDIRDGVWNVIAGAGAGKTLVLSLRTAKMIEEGISPSNICMVTFTKKAQENMLERLSSLIGEELSKNITVKTFHSLCFAMLKEQNYLPQNINIIKPFQQEKFINEAIDKLPLKNPLDFKTYNGFIGVQKNNLIDKYGDFIIADNSRHLIEDYRMVYEYYETEKSKINAVDFGDMVLLCHDMLKNNEMIRKFYSDRFKYIMVDEAQDTGDALFKIIQLLAKGNENILFVSDVRQCIFGFTGAKVENIIHMEKYFPNYKKIDLPINYRSTENIVTLGNKLIKKNTEFKVVDSIANKGKGNKPVFMCNLDEVMEAETFIQEIKNLHDREGYSYKDNAILTRTNAGTRAIEEACIKNEIPYIVYSSTQFFDRKEAKDILAYLSLIENENNDIALERVINTPNRFLGKAFIDDLKQHAKDNNISLYKALDAPFTRTKSYWRRGMEDIKQIIKHLKSFNRDLAENNVPKLINEVLLKTGYIDYLKKIRDDDSDNNRIENIEGLKICSEKFKNVESFLGYVRMSQKKAQEMNEQNADKVVIMTTHKSKGLEFKNVFVSAVNEGLYPHFRCQDNQKEIQSDLRLLYVAITRAMDNVYVSWTLEYSGKIATESRFIQYMISQEEIDRLNSVWDNFTGGDEEEFEEDYTEEIQKEISATYSALFD